MPEAASPHYLTICLHSVNISFSGRDKIRVMPETVNSSVRTQKLEERFFCSNAEFFVGRIRHEINCPEVCYNPCDDDCELITPG